MRGLCSLILACVLAVPAIANDAYEKASADFNRATGVAQEAAQAAQKKAINLLRAGSVTEEQMDGAHDVFLRGMMFGQISAAYQTIACTYGGMEEYDRAVTAFEKATASLETATAEFQRCTALLDKLTANGGCVDGCRCREGGECLCPVCPRAP